jgi:transposase
MKKVFGDHATVERLSERLKKTYLLEEYRRIQCVLIRATLGSRAKEIASLLGWSVVTVRIFQSRWMREGDTVLDVGERGGRHHEYLREGEEKVFLEPLVERAKGGNLVTAQEIRRAYEGRIGHPVAASTVYRLLARHGWRKVVPRPRHPQADPVGQTAFKKNSVEPCVGK